MLEEGPRGVRGEVVRSVRGAAGLVVRGGSSAAKARLGRKEYLDSCIFAV